MEPDGVIESNWHEVVDSFDEMNLSEALLRGIYAYGFEKPSAIQQRAILPCIKGETSINQYKPVKTSKNQYRPVWPSMVMGSQPSPTFEKLLVILPCIKGKIGQTSIDQYKPV
uniref:RNA helicase n=1 Tax=Taeniopygia guttata TaxID=59729 RepID=A0A674HPL2_TAEGU